MRIIRHGHEERVYLTAATAGRALRTERKHWRTKTEVENRSRAPSERGMILVHCGNEIGTVEGEHGEKWEGWVWCSRRKTPVF